MFSSSLHVAFTTIVAYTVAVFAAPTVSTTSTPSLTVETSNSDVNVNGLENLNVAVNTSEETLKLLDGPRGDLDPFLENAITDSSGSRPLFSGTKVNHASGCMIDLSTNTFGLRV